MKKRILIDIDAAAQSSKSGIGFYTLGLAKALAEYDPGSFEVVGHYFNFLGRTKVDLPILPNFRYIQSKFFPRKILNSLRRVGLEIPYEFFTHTKADFIVFPNFIGRRTLFKTPYCVTVHDFTYVDHPELVSAKNQKDLEKLVPKTMRSAHFVAAISKTMATKLAEIYPWFKKPVIAELLPVEPKQSIEDSLCKQKLRELGIKQPYILFVGNLEPRKNIEGLVKAYVSLPDDTKNTHALVLAGAKGWNDEVIQDTIDNAKGKGANIVEAGYVSSFDRSILYAKASVFAFPSFYEGYGLPLLEAMTYDVPTLSSNIPVLKEVAGDASHYCNPAEPRDIANKLEELLTNTELRERLIKNGREVVDSRSWRKIAKSMIEAM